ncbi:VOC family protein [Salinibacterium sp. ZJ70]|uniref:VOC family protein n=1 Tax=Salinibacterium sp. ZJ70 TaxID=2708084 RepID=UPI001423FA46|nr:VOC family protein [Salinibacterium sp. ZJ70]
MRSSLHHIGITVSNIDEAIRFYSAVSAGSATGPLIKSGPAVEAVTGASGAQIAQAFVTPAGGGAVIELLEYRGAPGDPIDPQPSRVGSCHAALIVADLDDALARAATLGVAPTSAPQVATQGPLEGWRYVYLIGPDEVRLELLEAPQPREHSVPHCPSRPHPATSAMLA